MVLVGGRGAKEPLTRMNIEQIPRYQREALHMREESKVRQWNVHIPDNGILAARKKRNRSC